MSTSNDRQQKELIQDRFTRTVDVFGDFVMKDRVREADNLARLVAANGNDRAVDLACGPGTLALTFARNVRWICGVDLTAAMLARARRTAHAEGMRNVAFALGDAHALPFADASLNLAVTSYSLHHMPDPARVLREMGRVLKPGGRAGVLDIFVPEDSKIAEINNRIERLRDPSHTRTLSKSELDKMFTAAGLRILATEVEEHPRSFDHWMHVAGWKRGDAAYIETRCLMEATIPDDGANFHPRYAPIEAKSTSERSSAAPDIAIINTSQSTAAEKI
jgi:ubiquinone/menaquinone biosynthesis C-methylase UbiE